MEIEMNHLKEGLFDLARCRGLLTLLPTQYYRHVKNTRIALYMYLASHKLLPGETRTIPHPVFFFFFFHNGLLRVRQPKRHSLVVVFVPTEAAAAQHREQDDQQKGDERPGRDHTHPLVRLCKRGKKKKKRRNEFWMVRYRKKW